MVILWSSWSMNITFRKKVNIKIWGRKKFTTTICQWKCLSVDAPPVSCLPSPSVFLPKSPPNSHFIWHQGFICTSCQYYCPRPLTREGKRTNLCEAIWPIIKWPYLLIWNGVGAQICFSPWTVVSLVKLYKTGLHRRSSSGLLSFTAIFSGLLFRDFSALAFFSWNTTHITHFYI